ncbi:MAG: 3-phosphoshikimate 1-carboxyvinyltransferase [Fibrobacter sp.]|jgi:3-phosphoshikimate 1-carboxyvinyltransferase|nr:3-phosphoshikimate 1-carboxyvinyltransferase [Fibrobacter sp.]
MKWIVRKSSLSGNIAIPPSKSHTIRAFLIASLAEGISLIRRPLIKGDGGSALRAAEGLGSVVEFTDSGVRITGIGDDFNRGSGSLDLGNSGTGTNLFASAAALGSRGRRFDGDDSLRSRPFRVLLDALRDLGAFYELEVPGRDLPFFIKGPLKGGTVSVNGISSQFVSSLLLSCPLIKDGNTEINVVNLHEKPYVELTLWWLDKQGIKYSKAPDLSKFFIPGNQHYSPFEISVPSDFSSATFAATAAAIAGGDVTLTGLDFSDPQGDKGVFDIIRLAGAEVDIKENGVTISGADLSGREIDLNSMPDALPALSVLACASRGVTRFINVKQARIKETDRIAVMCRELSKMGADISEEEDGLVVRESRLRGAVVNGYYDHRVVMALALAGMIAEGETVIETAEAADVTYPGFVNDFRKIGADIETEN